MDEQESSVSERSYTTMDKTGWSDGPWNDEPDKVQWTDETTGFPCLAVRNRLGAWCGYAGVTADHPWFGLSYTDDKVRDVEAHGCLTYADRCQEGNEAESICHIPAPGQPDEVWWFGFDCAHGCDIVPGVEARDRERGWPPIGEPYSAYRTLAYVRGEVASLARQLIAQTEAEGPESITGSGLSGVS